MDDYTYGGRAHAYRQEAHVLSTEWDKWHATTHAGEALEAPQRALTTPTYTESSTVSYSASKA